MDCGTVIKRLIVRNSKKVANPMIMQHTCNKVSKDELAAGELDEDCSMMQGEISDSLADHLSDREPVEAIEAIEAIKEPIEETKDSVATHHDVTDSLLEAQIREEEMENLRLKDKIESDTKTLTEKEQRNEKTQLLRQKLLKLRQEK